MYPLTKPLRSLLIFVGETLFISGYGACRAVSVAALLSGGLPGYAVPAWLATEFFLFNVAKWVYDSWRFWARRIDTVAASVIMNATQYFLIATAPITWIRHPFLAGPHLFAAFLGVTMLSNVAMMAVAFRGNAVLGVLELTEGGAWGVLGLCAAISAVGLALLLANIEPRFRPGFCHVRTTRDHVRMLWTTCTQTSKKFGNGPDDARARTLYIYARRYWPPGEDVKAWLGAHPEWFSGEAPPRWLSAKYLAMFPPEWLPPSAQNCLFPIVF